ncbi:MAG TPA: PsbP-related protein [Candidatus Gracilibacteria bacterium]
MKRFILCLSLILTMSLITGCGSKNETTTPTTTKEAKVNQYDSQSLNFSYPEGWVLRESDTPVGRVILIYAPETEKGVQTNLNIIVQDLSGSEEPLTLESYTKLSKDSLGDIVEGLDILSEGKKELDGNPGFEISYKGSTQTTPNKKFQWWQAWTVVDNQAYIFTLTGEPSTIKNYVPAVNSIVDSLEIK